MKDASLTALTDGKFQSLGELTEKGIEEFLGCAIAPGNVGPIFDRHGEPVMRHDGTQLCLSYTHGTLFAAQIAKNAAMDNVKNTLELGTLPVPYWQPTDIMLFTNDGFVIAAVRSNATGNAVGNCLTAAAGYPKMKTDGLPQTTIECAQAELKEEAGLDMNAIAEADEVLNAGVSSGRPMQFFPIQTSKGEMQGLCPTIARNIAIKSRLDVTELMLLVTANHESVGFIAMKVAGIAALLDKPDTVYGAGFWRSDILRTLLPDADALLTPYKRLDVLRPLLEAAPVKPQPGNYAINKALIVGLTREDFMHKGSMETLKKTRAAIDLFAFPAGDLNLAGKMPALQR